MPPDIKPDPASSSVRRKQQNIAGDSSLGSFPNTGAVRTDKPTFSPNAHETGADPAPALPKSLAGYKFDDFKLLEELGRGGMGIVYKAKQTSLDRIVAIKMLRSEHTENATILQRFQSEARAAAGLEHPSIVKIYQVGKSSIGHYFVMEFIEGQSLEAFVQKGPLPFAGSAALLQRVAEAVHFAHGRGIIHRDLKPANIMINRFRQPVVLDFGIVKFVGGSASVTQEGVIVGTPSFLPPEQTGEDANKVGPFSDVYSLGAVLYAMLTGRPPYEGRTALETLVKVMSPTPPTAIRELRPDVPDELDRICMKCLSKAPADRYQTAQALVDDLRRYRIDTKNAGGPVSSMHKSPPVFLVVMETGKQIRLTNPVTIIGRANDCDIIFKAPDVSKRHCQILWDNGETVVEDLESSNGTSVNGHMVERCRLEDGDQLAVGEHHFQIRLPKSRA